MSEGDHEQQGWAPEPLQPQRGPHLASKVDNCLKIENVKTELV